MFSVVAGVGNQFGFRSLTLTLTLSLSLAHEPQQAKQVTNSLVHRSLTLFDVCSCGCLSVCVCVFCCVERSCLVVFFFAICTNSINGKSRAHTFNSSLPRALSRSVIHALTHKLTLTALAARVCAGSSGGSNGSNFMRLVGLLKFALN